MLALTTTWWQLGLPQAVFSDALQPLISRLDSLDTFTRDTRLLVLDQTWWRVRAQIESIDSDFPERPLPPHARQLRRNLEQQRQELQHQIALLRHQR
jgi:hypothetical protein